MSGSTAVAAAEAQEPEEVMLGAYYYPWYRSKGNSYEWKKWMNTMRLYLEERQEPMLGLYDSADPEVVGAHIEQSLRAGIDFWSVSWWGPGSKTDRIFKKAVLPHPDSDKLKYALLYESTGRFGSFSKPSYRRWKGDLEYMRKHYFDHPSYLKIDGRPVLFVYLSREYFRNRGGEALKLLREEFPEVYLIGDDVFYGEPAGGEPEPSYKPEWAEQFDAITAYDVYGQSVKVFGGTRKALQVLTDNYAEAKAVANSVGTAFVPAIAPGYNDRAVRGHRDHPGRARYFTDDENSKEGDVFRAMINDVALPNLDPKAGNMIMVTSFNEWYEDSQIEPTAGTAKPSNRDSSDTGTFYTGGDTYNDYGYLYLDILKEELEGR